MNQDQKQVWDRLPELTQEYIIAMLNFSMDKRRKYKQLAKNIIVGYTSVSEAFAKEFVDLLEAISSNFVSKDKMQTMRYNWATIF